MGLKGQAAAEYLVLLAMVLIVSLIGLLLVGGFGDSGASSMDANSKTYWSGAANPFTIDEWAQIGSTVYLKITNKKTDRVILKKIYVGDIEADLGTGWTIGPGSHRNISISGFSACNAVSYDYYSYNVTFQYDTTDIAGRTQIGAKPIAGKCTVQ
ncbi:MAG: hypothetical protein WC492_04780 [Candidatus Micrarchaeia archaeon]